LLALVDDITDFESIRAGRLRLRFTRVSAQEVVSRALEACGGQIATKKHRVEVAVPQEPVLLTADQVRLTQILINLIGNAVKYTPTGGELKISVEHSKSEVSFRIGDSGIGIDPEFRPHVFDMFVQAPMRNRPRDGGLGLGLALVRDLAELHGGVVTVESAGKGLGAAFTVTLPRAGTQREGPAVTPSRVRSAAKPGSRDQSI
jgi:two-component system CheB/CheR fusion protein